MRKIMRVLALMGGACTICSGAHAESLADALALAYQTNPTLLSQRAQLRALDESYVQARSSYRPQLSLTETADFSKTTRFANNTRNNFPASEVGGLSLSASQILFDGGQTFSNISAAEADILTARERLRANEGNLLLSVIQAYASVVRDQQLLELRRQSVEDYQRQADSISARLRVRDVTRTDQGQIDAQVALARASYIAAEGQLQASRASYAALVGQNPGQLDPLPLLAGLPRNVDEAFAAAERDNPLLLEAILAQRASQYRVASAVARNSPTVRVTANYGKSSIPLSPLDIETNQTETSARVAVAVPLATGGYNRSVIRQAQETEQSRRAEIEQSRRGAVQTVSQAWNQMVSSRRQREMAELASTAAEISSQGSKLEFDSGLRSNLEVLIEQQRLRDAQALVLSARYNDFTGQAGLLNAMGRLNVENLTDGVPAYDPSKNFDRVRNKGGFITDPVVSALNGWAVAKPRAPVEAEIKTLPATMAPGAAPPPVGLITASPTDPLTAQERAASIEAVVSKATGRR